MMATSVGRVSRGGATDTEEPIAAERGAIRVFLVDDHELFLDTLARRLEVEPTIVLVGRETNAADARRALSHVTADVLVVDAQLDNESGIELVGLALSDRLAPSAVVVAGARQRRGRCASGSRQSRRGFVLPRSIASTSSLTPSPRCIAVRPAYPTACWPGSWRSSSGRAARMTELVRRLEMLTDRETRGPRHARIGCRPSGHRPEPVHLRPHRSHPRATDPITKLNVHSQLEAVSVALRAGLRRDLRADVASASRAGETSLHGNGGGRGPGVDPSFISTRWMYPRRVDGRTPDRYAMPLVDCPSTRACSTSCSRSVRKLLTGSGERPAMKPSRGSMPKERRRGRIAQPDRVRRAPCPPVQSLVRKARDAAVAKTLAIRGSRSRVTTTSSVRSASCRIAPSWAGLPDRGARGRRSP